MHRVCCDNPTFQIENRQQFLHGRDLIGLVIHTDAAQAEVHMLRPRIDNMQWLLPVDLVVRSTHRLAINSDRFSVQ